MTLCIKFPSSLMPLIINFTFSFSGFFIFKILDLFGVSVTFGTQSNALKAFSDA